MLVKEKKPNNYLIAVTNLNVLELKVNNLNFLFPITGLSVGFLKTFTLEEITSKNSYLLINRILDKKALLETEELLKKDLSNIKGICFTDLALINLVKKNNLPLELIYFQTHNTTNYKSINYYLEYLDSVLVSTDITLNEINIILDKANKPLVIPYFIPAEVMYSRRTLLSNYQKELNLPIKNVEKLKEKISNQDFLVMENEYGTIFYTAKFLDYRQINHPNILYKYLNPSNLDNDQILKIINNEDLKEITTEGFLNKETYYKLKED